MAVKYFDTPCNVKLQKQKQTKQRKKMGLIDGLRIYIIVLHHHHHHKFKVIETIFI